MCNRCTAWSVAATRPSRSLVWRRSLPTRLSSSWKSFNNPEFSCATSSRSFYACLTSTWRSVANDIRPCSWVCCPCTAYWSEANSSPCVPIVANCTRNSSASCGDIPFWMHAATNSAMMTKAKSCKNEKFSKNFRNIR